MMNDPDFVKETTLINHKRCSNLGLVVISPVDDKDISKWHPYLKYKR